jgi:short-subunit dehydrogenase
VRALVTGASSGIGAALARRLAGRGVEIWLAARRAALLDAQVAAINVVGAEAGGRAHALTLDVGDADATFARLGALDEEVGGIDLVIANAGTGGEGLRAPAEASWASTREMIGVNLLGAIATLAPFIPRMVARGRGHLVGISSIAALIVNPSGAVYSATKAALSTYLESIDIDLRARGVAVTCVEPGFIATDAARKANGERMPLLLSVERGVEIIDNAIQRRARLCRFPWLTGAVARTMTALPRPLRAPIIRGLTKPKR